MGIYSCCRIADIAIVVVRRLCVVFDRSKIRAGRVGAYLKAIVTCVINFEILCDQFSDICDQFSDICDQFSDTCFTIIVWLWNGDGGWASIVAAASQTLLLSSLDDLV